MFVIKYSSLHSRCAADIYFFPFLSRSISCPNSLCHLCIGMQSICKFCRQISDAPYSGLPKKNLERWDGGRGGAQSCRITCKFSTSPSIGWHGTSFDQKLTAQQYTEAFINVRRCRMQRCHWQMPSLSHSVYLSLSLCPTVAT